MADTRPLPKEIEMERAIREGVGYRGGHVFSVRDSRKLAVEHMPDLLIVAPHIETVALIELKSQRRDLTDGQRHVLDLLTRCDRLLTGVCRPVPRDGEIGYDELLQRLDITEATR